MGIFSFIANAIGTAAEMSNDQRASEFGFSDGYNGRAPNTFPLYIQRLKDIYMNSYKLGQQRSLQDKSRTSVYIPPQQM